VRRWLLLAGIPLHRTNQFRRQLSERGYSVISLIGNSPQEWQQSYLDFVETCVGAGGGGRGAEEPLWIGFIGMGEAADGFAQSYYDYYRVRPPHVAVLLSPTVTAYFLNQLTCPYLVIHGQDDPLFKEISHEVFDEAVFHHQMRYGDPTIDLIKSGLGRELGLERGREIDPRVAEEVLSWLDQVPGLGVSKEGLRARGFRLTPFRDIKRRVRRRFAA
jgi:hypothetical protein